MNRIIFLILFLSMPVYVQAAHIFNEAHYQNEWCLNYESNQIEHELIDHTRVDCLTKNYAVEFDFAHKWAEAVGQALHYSIMTGKKPAIVLIIEKPKDFKYYNRVKPLCEEYGISLWYIKSSYYKKNEK